jgi:hypothetical protein
MARGEAITHAPGRGAGDVVAGVRIEAAFGFVNVLACWRVVACADEAAGKRSGNGANKDSL